MSRKMLLLSCCAPCSCAVIEKLAQEGRDFTVAFYNPNIRPEAEYCKRRDENMRLCRLFGVPFVELEYDPERWRELVRGHEDDPERGPRCGICFKMRLKRVMEYAAAEGYDCVASVLGVSRYKNLAQVNEAAYAASQECGVAYEEVEGRKGGMQERRGAMIKALGLYSQDYCGCKPRLSKSFQEDSQ